MSGEYCVYVITCRVNGKQYCGQTHKGAWKRWQQHVETARSGGGYALHAAIRKHGVEAFDIEVLFDNLTLVQANEREASVIMERRLIARGYNQCEGGGNLSKTPEVRAKISATLKGRSMPLEQRREISEKLIGRTFSPEHCRRLSLQKQGDRNPARRVDVKAKSLATRRTSTRRKHDEVLKLAALGLSHQVIATQVNLTLNTIRCLMSAHNRGKCVSCQIV